MKLMAMLLCVTAFVSLSSCTKDNEDLIVGKWKMAKTSEIWEFSKDGYFFEEGERVAKYTVSDNTILFYWIDRDGEFTEDENDWHIFTILSLSDTHMSIKEVAKGEGAYDEETGTYKDWVRTHDFERV